MIQTFRNAFKIPDLRKKILYTLMMFVVIRLGAHIPLPGVDPEVIKDFFKSNSEGVLGLFDAITGGAFATMSIFAMGIVPYINSSIIMNLLTIAIPKLEEMHKDGDEGRKKIAKITRYLTVALAAIQAFGITYSFRSMFKYQNVWSYIIAIIVLTAGTAFLMWVGERITEKGIGNGISLIIFINIISRAPQGAAKLLAYGNPIKVAILLVLFIGVIAFVVLMQLGERRIPVQYAKKMQGRKTYGGQSTNIPLKVNTAGVIPIIFAMSLLTFPQLVTRMFTTNPTGTWNTILTWLDIRNHWFGITLYVVLIIFFAYFYTSITFNPMEVANNMKKNGGFIPGIRPGKPTVEYFNKVLNNVVLIGAIGLSTIALLPIIFSLIFNMNITFGATSLLIVVGVALETVKQIEAQMLMRHYKGFLNS